MSGPSFVDMLQGIAKSQPVADALKRETGRDVAEDPSALDVSVDGATNQLILRSKDRSRDTALRCLQVTIAALERVSSEVALTISTAQAQELANEIRTREATLSSLEARLQEAIRNSRVPYTTGTEGGRAVAEYRKKLEDARQRLARLDRELHLLDARGAKLGQGSSESPLPVASLESIRLELNRKKQEEASEAIALGDRSPRLLSLRQERRLLEEKLSRALSEYRKGLSDRTVPEVAVTAIERDLAQSEVAYLQDLLDAAPNAAITIRSYERQLLAEQAAYTALVSAKASADVESRTSATSWRVLSQPRIDENASKKPYKAAIVYGLLAWLLLWFSIAKAGRRDVVTS